MCFFFFNDTATTEIYTLSLHDALPISLFSTDHDEFRSSAGWAFSSLKVKRTSAALNGFPSLHFRSEEHTSELQSRPHLVCRLLLEKKNRRTYSKSPCDVASILVLEAQT